MQYTGCNFLLCINDCLLYRGWVSPTNRWSCCNQDVVRRKGIIASLLEITQDGRVPRTIHDRIHGEHMEMGWLQDGGVVQFQLTWKVTMVVSALELARDQSCRHTAVCVRPPRECKLMGCRQYFGRACSISVNERARSPRKSKHQKATTTQTS
jgi:hypothetical protein